LVAGGVLGLALKVIFFPVVGGGALCLARKTTLFLGFVASP
jgi:hypothetical protein